MKALKITTDNEISVIEVEQPLYKSVGEHVGGYIELPPGQYLPDPFQMICHEEARLVENPQINIIGSEIYGTPEHGHPVCGNIVIMKNGFDEDGFEDLVGLTDEDIEALIKICEVHLKTCESRGGFSFNPTPQATVIGFDNTEDMLKFLSGERQ